MQVFISYRNLVEYREWTERLKAWLEERGYTVWLDRYNIERGIAADSLTWRQAIARGIRESQVMLVVYAPECFNSKIVIDEWALAEANGLHIFFLMVKNVPVKDVLPGYVGIQHLDMESHPNPWGTIEADLKKAVAAPRVPLVDSFGDYMRGALETFFQLIDHRTSDHAFGELDVQMENTPGQVQSPPTMPAPKYSPMQSKMFLREGLNQSDEATPPEEIEIGSLKEGMDKLGGRLLLLGEPGAGKTFALYQYARSTLKRRLNDPVSEPLPIYLICSTWQYGQTLMDWIHSQWPTLSNLQESDLSKTLLLLDGFDELGTSRTREVEREIEETTENEHGTKILKKVKITEYYDPRPPFLDLMLKTGRVLLSCRIKEYQDFSTKLNLNGAVTMRPLTNTQIQDYLSDLPDLWYALSTDKDLLKVMRTPLLLSLFAFGYRDAPESARALRDLKAGELSEAIFNQYVLERFKREAIRFEEMEQTSPFTLNEIYEVLGHIAMVNASGQGYIQDNVLHYDDFERMLKNRTSVEIFAEYAILLHLLVPIEKALRFIHLRLRDHFVRAYCYPRIGNEEYYSFSFNPAHALASLPNSEASNVLVSQLRHKNSKVRQYIAESLDKIGWKPKTKEHKIAYALAKQNWSHLISFGEMSIEVLITELANQDKYVHLKIVEVLAEIGDKGALESLLTVLRDGDNHVRATAILGLGKIGDMRAVKPLIDMLRDQNFVVRRYASNVLDKLDWVPKTEEHRVAYAFAKGDWSYLVSLGVIAVDYLIAALKYEDTWVLRNIAETLGEIGDVRAIEYLVTILKNDNWYTAIDAAKALGKIGDIRSVEPLIIALNSKDRLVRISVIQSLGQIGDSRATEPLLDLLDDPIVSQYAQEALQSIGTPEALAALKSWCKNQSGK
ncbi:MAG: HEAT repeat domain-containing protein [Anaerolineae bacterium]|nr:HEAT repeat domain-containing protein [Anaerolineae bacterium]